MSDPQQERVYDLENRFVDGWLLHTPPLSGGVLQACADAVCRRYRVPPVKVVLPRRKHSYLAQYFGGDDPVVKLYVKKRGRASSRNLPVLLHELAHHVETCRFDGEEAHGPKFVAILAEMFDHYQVVPRESFVAMAKKMGVRVGRTRKRRVHK